MISSNNQAPDESPFEFGEAVQNTRESNFTTKNKVESPTPRISVRSGRESNRYMQNEIASAESEEDGQPRMKKISDLGEDLSVTASEFTNNRSGNNGRKTHQAVMDDVSDDISPGKLHVPDDIVSKNETTKSMDEQNQRPKLDRSKTEQYEQLQEILKSDNSGISQGIIPKVDLFLRTSVNNSFVPEHSQNPAFFQKFDIDKTDNNEAVSARKSMPQPSQDLLDKDDVVEHQAMNSEADADEFNPKRITTQPNWYAEDEYLLPTPPNAKKYKD